MAGTTMAFTPEQLASLESYRVDHLCLLVGNNPLPNFVAAQLLCTQGGQFTSFTTPGTASIEKGFSEGGVPRLIS